MIPNMNLLKASNHNESEEHSIIKEFFNDDMIKMLYYHACRVDIPDNNDKAEMVKELLGPEFVELGTGTNRIAFLHNGLVCKIALDRRGLIDNLTEYKRSGELPEYLAKVYETNMLVDICEYVTVMDAETFIANKEGILAILEDMSKAYLFDDIGFTTKNCYNWGYRADSGDIVILDYGYLYNLKGQESAITCPKCKAMLKYNNLYTGFVCSNKGCGTKYTNMDIMRRRNLDMENFEDEMICELQNIEMPDLIDSIMEIE